LSTELPIKSKTAAAAAMLRNGDIETTFAGVTDSFVLTD